MGAKILPKSFAQHLWLLELSSLRGLRESACDFASDQKRNRGSESTAFLISQRQTELCAAYLICRSRASARHEHPTCSATHEPCGDAGGVQVAADQRFSVSELLELCRLAYWP